ncbi:MAG: hypothetical protein ABI598_01980 [Chloroflexota bacterium]
MADVAEAESMGTAGSPSAAPYKPSWVNLVIRRIERLPGPAWLAYLILASVGILTSVPEALSRQASGNDLINAVYYGALPGAIFFLIHHLDGTTADAIRGLRPLLAMGDEEVEDLGYRLTIIPARPAMIAAVISMVLGPLGYLTDPVGSGIVGLEPWALGLRYFWETMISASFLLLIFHTYRQLRLIDQLHHQITTVDLFDQAPLYRVSRVTSQTAVGLILLLVPGVFLIPAGAGASTILLSLAWYGAAVLVAIAAFVLPLRGMHVLVMAEKRRLAAETGRRITITLNQIHAAVDAGDGETIGARNGALSTLIAQRDLVARVPTWPWSTGSLTGFVSAILLPIALFLIQRVLTQIV